MASTVSTWLHVLAQSASAAAAELYPPFPAVAAECPPMQSPIFRAESRTAEAKSPISWRLSLLSLPSFPSLSPPLRSNYFASRSGRVQISHQSRPAKPWGVPRRRWRAAAAAARCRGICGLGIEPVRLTVAVAESADRRLP